MSNKSFLNYKKTAAILISVAVVWLIFDKITKNFFDSGQFHLGQNISESILGIFHLTLVHNTGAAFGIFSNSTFVLAIISILVSVFLFIMPFIHLKRLSMGKTNYKLRIIALIPLSLIIAGGIGNSIDRIISGYVVDFICFDFIDFPVFNVADIGVTCGIFILVLTMIFNVQLKKENNEETMRI